MLTRISAGLLLAGLCITLCPAPQGASAQTAAPGSLDDRIRAVLPTREEDLWLQIPWRADFTAARAEAEKTGKPLFMWVMDGNPLGCG